MTNIMGGGLPVEHAIEDDEWEYDTHKNSVHRRLRANSSIMHLKKLLGESTDGLAGRPRMTPAV
jgi:hypothetical protein